VVEVEARLFGVTTFASPFYGVAHFSAGPFWGGPFWHKFHKNNFFLLLFSFSNFSVFLIYIIFFIFLFTFFSFFQKQSKIFWLFLINFFPLYMKKYKFKHTATFFWLFQ